MKTWSKTIRATIPVALPGRLFAQIAQEAAATGHRELAIEFIDMAYLAFSAAIEDCIDECQPRQAELTLTPQD